MRRSRILLAAPKSGSGKTLISLALLKAIKNRKKEVTAFKCGPDYIDPMFHRKVMGVESHNLDTYFTGDEVIRSLFMQYAKEDGYAVIEGVMGLYDGLGGTEEKGSAYDLAGVLDSSVILVVDAHGMGRSILPLIAGFLQFDKKRLICGVILNRVSKGFYERIAPRIEQELNIRVFGYYPVCKELQIDSRHLGLKLPDEILEIQDQIEKAAALLEETVDVDGILKAAEDASDLKELPKKREEIITCRKKIKIGVARDEAFCFYYEENLSLLEELGAEIVFFSPIHDTYLPDGICGLVLGGGYPELYAKALSENESMRVSIKESIAQGMPSLAECGGFLYLHQTIQDMEKRSFRMCNVFPKDASYQGKLIRFGYVELQEKTPCFLKKGETIKGHEFHYYDSEENGSDCLAVKPVSGKSWECVMEGENHFWGFPHLYYPSCPDFAKHFIKEIERYGKLSSVF